MVKLKKPVLCEVDENYFVSAADFRSCLAGSGAIDRQSGGYLNQGDTEWTDTHGGF